MLYYALYYTSTMRTLELWVRHASSRGLSGYTAILHRSHTSMANLSPPFCMPGIRPYIHMREKPIPPEPYRQCGHLRILLFGAFSFNIKSYNWSKLHVCMNTVHTCICTCIWVSPGPGDTVGREALLPRSFSAELPDLLAARETEGEEEAEEEEEEEVDWETSRERLWPSGNFPELSWLWSWK